MTDKNHDPLDSLLAKNLVTPPHNFSARVLEEISPQSPNQHSKTTPDTSMKKFWTFVALASGTMAGGFQIIAFIFGIWIPTTVG